MKSFDERPDQSEAPNQCQYTGCDNPPTKVVRFRDPKEYICYCREHAREQKHERPGAKYKGRIKQ